MKVVVDLTSDTESFKSNRNPAPSPRMRVFENSNNQICQPTICIGNIKFD